MMLQQQSENEINKKKAEQMKNEWQPPKLDSSSEEESDEEIGEDVELSRWEWRKKSSGSRGWSV